MSDLSRYKNTECDCEYCRSMCLNRCCWPLPEEARKLIEAGYSNRLMLDYWADNDDMIYLLCPALVGYEGKQAPYWPTGKCTFVLSDGLCEIHSGLKPIEGRICSHSNKKEGKEVHYEIMKKWDSVEGHAVLKMWIEEHPILGVPVWWWFS